MRHPGPFFNETLTHLRRKFRPRKRLAGVLLDLFYFIVLDVLVILFMVQRTQDVSQRVPAVELELPAVSEVQAVALDHRLLTVYGDQLFFDANPVKLADLDRRFREMASADPDMTLIIAADKRLPHGDLLSLINRAMKAGISKVALAGRVRSGESVNGGGR